MSQLIDEPSRIRFGVEIADCEPIILADGQAWLFPKPFVDFTPRYEDGRAVVVVESEYEPHLAAYADAVTVGDVMRVKFELARTMLLKVYDLTDAEIARLLKTHDGSEEDEARWLSILGVAMGAGPKPSPGGGGSPS